MFILYLYKYHDLPLSEKRRIESNHESFACDAEFRFYSMTEYGQRRILGIYIYILEESLAAVWRKSCREERIELGKPVREKLQ